MYVSLFVLRVKLNSGCDHHVRKLCLACRELFEDMTDVEREAIVCDVDHDESELNRFSDNASSKSVVHQLLDHINSHEKSFERRGFSER